MSHLASLYSLTAMSRRPGTTSGTRGAPTVVGVSVCGCAIDVVDICGWAVDPGSTLVILMGGRLDTGTCEAR